MKRKEYKGTCTLRYYNVYTLLEITGIYKNFAKKIQKNMEEWPNGTAEDC